MAVIEIAKIQVRRGQENQTGLPVLAGGEFAWAADTESLYIGLKREDGGARDANVRILTENDLRNFFVSGSIGGSASGSYIYRSGTEITVYNTGSSIQTELYSGTEISRTLQDRLDDFVVIKNFGVSGDGGDNTQDEFIQLAIDKLYISTETEYALPGTSITPPAKVLYFPAGQYAITGTIYLPKNVTIMGEGIDKTVFILHSNGEHVFQTIDGEGRHKDQKIPGTHGIFTSTAFSITSPDEPNNIHIEGVTIQYATTSATTLTGGSSLLMLDCAAGATLRRVKFKGNYLLGSTADDNYSAIDMRGYTLGYTTENVVIDDCQFEGLHTGVKSNFDINNVIIQNSSFYHMHHGVALNKAQEVIASVGPRHVRMINNKFRAIEAEAIYAGESSSNTATNHLSMNNQFINVGNDIYGIESATGTAVISFLSKGNVTVNDYFDRQDFQDQHGGTYTYNPLVAGRTAIDAPFAGTATVISDGSQTLMRLPITGTPQFLTLKYSCSADLGGSNYVDRMGTVQYYIKEGSDPEVIISDDYNAYSSDGALYWGAVVDASYKFIEVNIYNPSTDTNGTGYPVAVEFQSHLIL